MVDQSLLEILVCPETKQPLKVAEPGLIERLNASIREGSLASRGGQVVTEPLAEGMEVKGVMAETGAGERCAATTG